MKKRYQQLTLRLRYQIQARHEAGFSQAQIAELLDCNKSTICRELGRCRSGYYQAEEAHRQAIRKRRNAAKATCNTPELMCIVTRGLKSGLAPAAIAGRLARECGRKQVSHETIYQWIYSQKREGGDLHKYLLRAHRGRRKPRRASDGRGVVPNRVSIEQRPKEANDRRTIGHWEGDTVHGKNGSLVTLVDRQSRYLLVRKVDRRTKDEVGKRLTEMLDGHRAKTITVDNGREFYGHEDVAKKSGTKIYFADPYASWQRGSNEHANGILRRFFPKGSDLGSISAQCLRRVVEKINMMPRKLLNWRSAYEVYHGVSVAVIT